MPAPPPAELLDDDELAGYIALVAAAFSTMILELEREPPRPYHTSALTGEAWVQELLKSENPRRMYDALGVSPDAFEQLVIALGVYSGLGPSKWVSAEEKVATFLYICRMSVGTRGAGERLQRGTETISCYFKEVLDALLSDAFYNTYTTLPNSETPISPIIASRSDFSPYFDDCIGAIDGTHVPAHVPASDAPRFRDRSGKLSFNNLAGCDFSMRFVYIYAGWEGSAADGRVFQDARATNFSIPNDKYYVADGGYPSCRALLVPYRGVRYHLREFRQSDLGPQNAQELFNLRHARLRNVIERIFGLVKRRHRILELGCEYPTRIQPRLFRGLCVLHNFLLEHGDGGTWDIDGEDEEEDGRTRGYQYGADDEIADLQYNSVASEQNEANQRRDDIASAMWQDYQEELEARM